MKMFFAVLVSVATVCCAGCAGSPFRQSYMEGSAGYYYYSNVVVPPPHTVWYGVNRHGTYRYDDSRGNYGRNYRGNPGHSHHGYQPRGGSSVYVTPAPCGRQIQSLLPH